MVYTSAMAIPDDLTPMAGPQPTLAPRESAPPERAAGPGPLPSPQRAGRRIARPADQPVRPAPRARRCRLNQRLLCSAGTGTMRLCPSLDRAEPPGDRVTCERRFAHCATARESSLPFPFTRPEHLS